MTSPDSDASFVRTHLLFFDSGKIMFFFQKPILKTYSMWLTKFVTFSIFSFVFVEVLLFWFNLFFIKKGYMWLLPVSAYNTDATCSFLKFFLLFKTDLGDAIVAKITSYSFGHGNEPLVQILVFIFSTFYVLWIVFTVSMLQTISV